MPVYEFFCATCDQVFTRLRSISEYHNPCDCPDCGATSPRVVATAPGLNTMRAETRKAHQTNERSAHEPRVRHSHTCGAGCNHSHHNKPKTDEPPKMKQQSGKRPWMLGH